MNKSIYPCLWFDGQAKAAADFYCSIFKNAHITVETPVVVKFKINGNEFMALNGGPMFKLSEAMSLVVECDTQEEIDYYWSRLTEGGQESMCGWLIDKYGVSWQIVPSIIATLMSDPAKAARLMQLFQAGNIRKINIQQLIDA
jgi:predicted 3-demethylubiquinone-9 3-methyltransferase (glyoxalase superfamily)